VIVVVGDLMEELVARLAGPLAHGSDAAATITRHSGGGGANVAAWLAYAGAEVALVARAGDDEAGRAATAALRRAGVDARVAHDLHRPTGTCLVLVDASGERTMVPDRAANDALREDDLPGELLAPGGHLHVSGYALLHPGSRPAAEAMLRRARAAGLTTSVDAASAAPLRAMGASAFLRAAGPVDLLRANASELDVLGKVPAGAARERLVTLGARGAWWTDGETEHRVAAPDIAAVDTTGAGDAFTAGWLVARMSGADPATALERATTLAARAVSHAGARP
jgi:ribokinase